MLGVWKDVTLLKGTEGERITGALVEAGPVASRVGAMAECLRGFYKLNARDSGGVLQATSVQLETYNSLLRATQVILIRSKTTLSS